MKTLRVFLGSGFVLYALYLSVFGFGRGDAFALPFVVLASGIGGVLLAPLIAARFSTVFDGLFYPNARGAIVSDLSRPRALMAEHRYEDAIAELRVCLAQAPDQIEAQILLANILHEKLGRSDEALALARHALDAGPWRPGGEKLVTLAVDILLASNAPDQAAALLRDGTAKAGRSPAAVHLRERLQHLEQM